jgi:hypothetical protein
MTRIPGPLPGEGPRHNPHTGGKKVSPRLLKTAEKIDQRLADAIPKVAVQVPSSHQQRTSSGSKQQAPVQLKQDAKHVSQAAKSVLRRKH